MMLLIWLQLADPKETTIDLPTLARRWKDLHDAPPVQDVARLPPKAYIRECLDFAHEHADYMEQLAGWRAEFRPWAVDARKYALFWNRCDTARSNWVSVHYKREILKQIRDTIGVEDYNHARWPAAAPFWRFHDDG